MKTKQELIDYIYTPEGKARSPRFKRELLSTNGFDGLITKIEQEYESIGLGDISLTDKIRSYCKNQIFVPHCKTCGNMYVNWSNKHQAWSKYCSQTCVQNDPEVKIKNRSDNYDDAIQKRTSTMFERYGIHHFSQLEESKENFAQRTKDSWNDPERKATRLEKRKETNLSRYGVEHTSQDSTISARMTESIKKRIADRSTGVKETIVQTYRETRMGSDVFGILESYEMMYDLYITKQNSILGISKIIGCSEVAVMYAIDKHNIPYDPDRQQSQVSIQEIELFEFIKGIESDAIHTYKDGKHIDIYIPRLNIGFEFNGVYWHSEVKKDRYYHSDKVDYFYDKGIRYIQIWEDDWNHRNEVVKNFIRNLLGQNKRIGARKTKLVELSQSDFDVFMNNNHMQGSTVASIRIGIDYEGQIVAAMGFKSIPSNTKFNNGYDLCRFANKNVTGAFRKLFERFLKTHSPSHVISFGDLEIIDKRTNVYLKNGFVEDGTIPSDYRYYNYRSKKREHKFGYRKSNFAKMGYLVDGKTERELAKEHKMIRCYDSGKIRYLWKP